MTTFSLDQYSAKALAWVAAGADTSDHGSVLIMEPTEDGSVNIYTNVAHSKRGISVKEISSSANESHTGAVRAKALLGVASKVDDALSMSVTIKNDRVVISSGATSLSLENLYDSLSECSQDVRGSHVISVDAYDIINSLSSAGNSVSPKDPVYISSDGDDFSIGSGSDSVFAKELIPATINGDIFSIIITASSAKSLKKLSKLVVLDTATLYSAKGLVRIEFPTPDEETSMQKIYVYLPTIVSQSQISDNPCDEDINEVLTIPRKIIESSIKPIISAVSPQAVLTIDTTQDNRVVLTATNPDGDAKTVVLDGNIHSQEKISAPIGVVVSSLAAVGTESVTLGTISHNEHEWMSISSVFKEDAESESENNDIVVALLS